MRYYFPSIITSIKFSSASVPDCFHSVNSGENAIRLLLRSYRLNDGARVALPFYVCDSLKQAVYKESFQPLYLDLKEDSTFWSDYDPDLLLKEKVDAIILVHLYGFVHPDTNVVMEFCKNKRIPLIHDAAQSFGIDQSLLSCSSGVVYSFGPGKSSTAAGGAIVKGLSDEVYTANCRKDSNVFNRNARARLFLKSRIYGYRFSLADKLLNRIVRRIKQRDEIAAMTEFQEEAGATALELVENKGWDRKIRHQVLTEAVKSNPLLEVPYSDEKGLCFKMVLSAGGDITGFKEYLNRNDVPWFSLKPSLHLDEDKQDRFPVFCQAGGSFVELSSEASIPMDEIERVASVLRRYS